MEIQKTDQLALFNFYALKKLKLFKIFTIFLQIEA